MARAIWMLAALALLLGGVGQARAEYLVTFQFTGHVTQSELFDIPPDASFSGLFSYYTVGNGWASADASPATPITMTLDLGPLSFAEMFTQPPNISSSGAGVFLLNLGQPYTTNIQAEATIRVVFPFFQDFWLVSFADNTGAVFTMPPPRTFDLSSFPRGGGLLFLDENLNEVSGQVDTLVGTAVPVPEPSSLTLLGLGSLGLLGYGWRRRKRVAG